MSVLRAETNNLSYVFREYYQDPVLGKGRSRVMYVGFDGVAWKAKRSIANNQRHECRISKISACRTRQSTDYFSTL